MAVLLLYLFILAIAAGVTFALFGDVAEDTAAEASALQFFASAVASSESRASPTCSTDTPPGTQRSVSGGEPATDAGGDGRKMVTSARGAAHVMELLKRSGVPAPQQEMVFFLARHCCVLPVESRTVRVLTHPTLFYEELTRRVMAAQHSITLSALYIGDGPLSKAFVGCMEERVRWAAASGRAFSITLLLDFNRMQDRRNLRTLKNLMELAQQTASAASLPVDAADAGAEPQSPPIASGSDSLADLADDTAAGSGVRVRLLLYQNPSRWNRLVSRVGRAKEMLGVQHTKLFVVDQRHTILTGANFSDDYFATRMDRYMVVQDNPIVARWFTQLVRTVCHISHPVVCRHAFASPTASSNNGASPPASAPPSPTRPLRAGSPTLHRSSDLVILPNAIGVDPSADTTAFCAVTRTVFHEFAAWARRLSTSETLDWDRYDTLLFPTVQVGRAGVYHDSGVVKELLRLSTAADRIFLTSPYLNMYAPFVEEVLHGTSGMDCITASVQTNGWAGQRGMAGRIPLFYLQLQRSFYFLMRSYRCLDRVRIREFAVKGLTFHAKGLWFAGRREPQRGSSSSSPPPPPLPLPLLHESAATAGEACPLDGIAAPYLVAYGSTNYGYRSVHKDVEAEAFLFTADDALRETLRQELVFLLRQSATVSEASFVGTATGRFQPVVSLAAHLGQDFL
ncbi:phosphatidylglycerolphosphate synthase, mitochondrial [Novymonas esmeraldas]|uniref:CDP-diacylglycerol--glycerol-3-phosphate 3-phosphatidyltransferase n=1 Tax=Novymonas esmeraldas TaxID=1808958 RepID=A0AAW0EME9_9TRYP